MERSSAKLGPVGELLLLLTDECMKTRGTSAIGDGRWVVVVNGCVCMSYAWVCLPCMTSLAAMARARPSPLQRPESFRSFYAFDSILGRMSKFFRAPVSACCSASGRRHGRSALAAQPYACHMAQSEGWRWAEKRAWRLSLISTADRRLCLAALDSTPHLLTCYLPTCLPACLHPAWSSFSRGAIICCPLSSS